MPHLTEGVAYAIRVADAPIASDDALAGAATTARGPASPNSDTALPLGQPYLEMGYTNQCLELIDTLMLMIAPPPSIRRRGGRAPA
ncbi:hypothetical protein CsSME_00035705 [Camellia sinensis var. sinensis]